MEIKYPHISTFEKQDAYLTAYPNDFQEVMGGSVYFGDDVVWDLAYQALQEGKRLRFRQADRFTLDKMEYSFDKHHE